MKNITKRIVIVLAGLPAAYVALYLSGVSPDGPINSEERIPLIYGWSPSYPLYETDFITRNPKMKWNGFIHNCFRPIHRIDRVVRKNWWLTSKEKEAEIQQASQPSILFTYDMAVVQILSEPPQIKKGRRKNGLQLLGFDDGLRYHSFTNCTTENWKQNYYEISKILIYKVEQLHLDTESFQGALNLVLAHSEDRIAYLPSSVHQAIFKGRQSWIIRVRWEYPSDDKIHSLGHIRHFIYDQKTLELIDYQTCM